MKRIFLAIACVAFLFTSCQENSYDRHSETDDLATDSSSGFETGKGTELIPIDSQVDAVNSPSTAVPLEPVIVDTTKPKK